MKTPLLLAAALLSASTAFAADPVKLDIYLNGKLEQQATLTGPHATYKFWTNSHPDTVLELRLVAPEPIIVDIRETTAGKASPNGTGQIKLVSAGDKVELSTLKNSAFQHPYVLVRPE